MTETAYIKYYLSDRNFIADAPMFATDRRGQSHLEVTFNENKHPVLKRWLNEKHELIREEMFVYNETKALQKRLFLNSNRRTEKIIHYGKRSLGVWNSGNMLFQQKRPLLSLDSKQNLF